MSDTWKGVYVRQLPSEGTGRQDLENKAELSASKDSYQKSVSIKCIAKVGSGYSNISIDITPQGFRQLLLNMMYVDRDVVKESVEVLNDVLVETIERERD